MLAHPRTTGYEVPDEMIGRLAAAGLNGIEVWHPDQGPAERGQVLSLATDLNLIPTGASDDHGELSGHRIGCETTAPENYQRLIAQAAGRPVTAH